MSSLSENLELGPWIPTKDSCGGLTLGEKKAAGRVASRSDLLGRVHLGEVQVGTLIEED